MAYSCGIVEQAAAPVLSIRTRSPLQGLPQAMSRAYSAIGAYLGQLAEVPAGPPFVAYFNMDMQDLDVELGFPVSRALPGQGEIQPGEIPAGKFATCVHVGSYQGIGAAYDALAQWMQQNNLQPTGVAYEIYLNDPAQVPPKQLETRILMPLKGG